jgi:hypothetical protein
VGHVGKEFAFSSVGFPCLQHRLMRDRRSLFSLLFCLEEGEAGISMFDQAAQARTVAF